MRRHKNGFKHVNGRKSSNMCSVEKEEQSDDVGQSNGGAMTDGPIARKFVWVRQACEGGWALGGEPIG
ncbi:hypothetical protein KIN20_002376 [Parelaphostrongylus tenuis]|uniref:Uncharacterized protein n=1 Tax=Parelaphostrongylus tenuis TaxID=148309 RepID=A0AAD5LVJ8_PARTN|nr:hypothetical protein KIN20_002376 [Parelaphostrongylus tenuis]